MYDLKVTLEVGGFPEFKLLESSKSTKTYLLKLSGATGSQLSFKVKPYGRDTEYDLIFNI